MIIYAISIWIIILNIKYQSCNSIIFEKHTNKIIKEFTLQEI